MKLVLAFIAGLLAFLVSWFLLDSNIFDSKLLSLVSPEGYEAKRRLDRIEYGLEDCFFSGDEGFRFMVRSWSGLASEDVGEIVEVCRVGGPYALGRPEFDILFVAKNSDGSSSKTTYRLLRNQVDLLASVELFICRLSIAFVMWLLGFFGALWLERDDAPEKKLSSGVKKRKSPRSRTKR